MSYGTFVDIRQQCGKLVRMYYPDTVQNHQVTRWIGINEQMADKFREGQVK
jgi:hypothetical protein